MNTLVSAEANGVRNAQASVIAPTGTISFAMDCGATSVEPVSYTHLISSCRIKRGCLGCFLIRSEDYAKRVDHCLYAKKRFAEGRTANRSAVLAGEEGKRAVGQGCGVGRRSDVDNGSLGRCV